MPSDSLTSFEVAVGVRHVGAEHDCVKVLAELFGVEQGAE
jgi:hypothetical protein